MIGIKAGLIYLCSKNGNITLPETTLPSGVGSIALAFCFKISIAIPVGIRMRHNYTLFVHQILWLCANIIPLQTIACSFKNANVGPSISSQICCRMLLNNLHV